MSERNTDREAAVIRTVEQTLEAEITERFGEAGAADLERVREAVSGTDEESQDAAERLGEALLNGTPQEVGRLMRKLSRRPLQFE